MYRQTIDLAIRGMSCAACVTRLERALQAVPGVDSVAVNLATERAHVTLNHATPSAMAAGVMTDTENNVGHRLVAAIDRAGYVAAILAGQPHDAQTRRARNQGLVPVIGACLLSLPLIFDSALPGVMQAILATIVQFWAGSSFYASFWRAARHGVIGMDALVVLGTSAAYGLSILLLILHPGEMLYFETSAVVISLVLVGKYLEKRARWQAGAAIRALQGLRPSQARIRADAGEREIALDLLTPGDILIIRPGERIAADGRVQEGTSAVYEAMLTGESQPVVKQPGDLVTGGTLNGDGLLAVGVTMTGAETVLAQIIRLVEAAQTSKAPLQRLVDQVAAIFVPVVLGLALLTFAGWWFAGHEMAPAILRAVAVLVVSCPCALGLATPTAIMAGTGIAARHGILIQNGVALEHLRKVTLVAFDKTGTITQGDPAVTAILTREGVTEAEALRLAAALQSGSEHPLARAVRRHSADIAPPPASDFRAEPGQGVRATVEGRALAFGSSKYLEAEDDPGSAALRAAAAAFEQQNKTVSWLVDASVQPVRALAIIAFADQIRPSAKPAIIALQARNVACTLLTGDNLPTAMAVGHAIGIDQIMARLSPADKAAEITRLRALKNIVAMVGDGINDAPALAAADIGIALGSGTDVAMATADITLMRSDPLLVAAAIDISRKTYAKIRQNLFWAFGYNIIGIPLAAFGLLDPMLAGAAMAFSSLAVVGNALLLRRWRQLPA